MSEKQHLLGKQPGNQSKPLYFSQYLTRVTVPISWVLSVLSLLLLLYLPQTVSAATAITWESLSTNQATIKLANPVRNRRSTDATVSVSLNNVSGSEITGPLRLVITNLTPTGKVSISNASGSTDTGEPYYDLTGYIGNNFTVGGSGVVSVIVAGGGPNIFSFQARLERQVTQNQALTIKITSPATLLTIGHTPQTVQGTVSDPTAQVTLNGAPVNNSNGSFQADVALEEGHNTITARAINAKGEDVTDAIALSLDMTPPYLTVESPKDGDIVRIDKIAVSGLINDIVRGTVADGQANVKVNGVAASVSNRSYLAENVALTEGDNTIKIDASDNVGNTTSLTIKVKYQPLAPQHIELLSGQNQAAKINATLVQPLKVKLLDGDNKPVANKPVIYRVTEGDGVVGAGASDEGQGVLVQTDALGVASTSFKLGSRAGTGNQRVRAASVGFDGEVLFYASATVGTGNKVTVNAGNNQRGAIGQPLSQPFVVAVVDDGANVVPGARIEFKVTQGSGKFQNDQTTVTSTTDSDGRATAEFTLGSEEGLDVHRVTATLVGTELYAGFTASALKTGAAGQTSISGVVMDNQEHPLPNVTVRVDGTTREAQTDAQGQFKITEAPVGTVHLIADGSTTTAEGEYPTLSFNLTTIAGADNPLSAPIYLVKLDTVNAKTVGDQDVTLTLPEVPGFALEVKAGSVTFPDGKKTGKLSVTPVNASKIPMAPPNGMQPQFIVTIQPVGAKFDPPAPLSLPNVDGHKPGAQVEMYSYDHDLEEFVAIGLGTVSTDGSIIKSNQGVGVIKAGWHCGSQPGGSGCCTSPGKCQTTDASCNIVNKPKMADVTGDCQSPKDCESTQVNDSDVPVDTTKGDCKKPGCKNGAVDQATPDSSDKPDPNVSIDNECKKCDDAGGIIADSAKDGSITSKDKCKACDNGAASSVSVQINTFPDKVCVNQTKPINVKLLPEILYKTLSGPQYAAIPGTGSASLSFSGSDGSGQITGTSAHADKTKFNFWVSDQSCGQKSAETYVLPKNVENIPGKVNRITAYNFMVATCPDFPSQDTGRPHEIDGCSGGIAQDPTNYGGLYVPYITGSQQYNQASTAFGQPQASPSPVINLPCNNHDINYQTCSATNQQATWDSQIYTEAVAVCNNAYPATCPAAIAAVGKCGAYADERQLCQDLASETYTGLQAFGFGAYYERQTQYCLCCGTP